MFSRRNNSRRDPLGIGLSPDEIFLDAENIPGYSQERFEGVIEKPFSKVAVYTFGIMLVFLGLLFFGRVIWLETVRGEEFKNRAVNNYIRKTYVEPPRGAIYDRNGTALVSNEPYDDDTGKVLYRRVTKDAYALSHIIGFVGENDDVTVLQDGVRIVGKAGIEQRYNSMLTGMPGERDEEIDAKGNVVSRSPIALPKQGKDITLTIDVNMQQALYTVMNDVMTQQGFAGGAGIVFSLDNGAILSLVSVPSFDATSFTSGMTHEEADALFKNPKAPLFNRAVSGTFAPGSTIKPFYAIAALEEGVIDSARNIFSAGFISVPDPYRPGEASIFKDNKAHGYVDMRRALTVSSNVYFYTIGGGYGDIKGLGVRKLKEWLERFQFQQPTGIDLAGEVPSFIPDPEWKAKAKPDNPLWRIGDTYHMSIGQGDLMVSPLGMARAIGMLATHGKALPLHLLKKDYPPITPSLSLNDANLKVVADGMLGVTKEGGTSALLSWIPINIAAKTGTAELGDVKDRINSWVVGYAPYEDPKIGFVVLLASGPRTTTIGATFTTSELFRFILSHGGIDAFTR